MTDVKLCKDAVILPMVECQKCHFKWAPRTANPVSCPECSCRSWRTWKPKERGHVE